ncbi:hypothetical protein AGMMS50230_05220 [Spirochaetia bacterium]|nr:hypothetical protein AGMMS50230_05220 [Spirochaetia bacterium]
MNKKTWTAFRKTAGRYRTLIDEISAVPDLSVHIQRLVDNREGPSYTVDTPAVYNLALDEFTQDSELKMILVADNPGRREQAAENRRYLVGPSGKIAEKFFRDNPVLGITFRKNVLILNKTPIHTPRTAELKELCKIGGKKLSDAVISSQQVMVELLAEFWGTLRQARDSFPVWIIGYSEMKKGGIFEVYTEKLKTLCADNSAFKESIFFYRHFSMNQFTIDLKQQTKPGENLKRSLVRIGTAYRDRLLG